MQTIFQKAVPKLASALGPANTEVFLDACRFVELAPGRKLFRDRMPVESLFLILEGDLAVTLEEGDKAFALGNVGAGQWLGEVSVLSGSMMGSATVTTVTACRALKLHYQDFDRLIRDNDDIANVLLSDLINLLASRLRVSSAAVGKKVGH